MDNATAEYSFISSFFTSSPSPDNVDASFALLTPNAVVPTPAAATPDTAMFGENRSPVTSDYEGSARHVSLATPALGSMFPPAPSKEDIALVDSIWKQTMDPVMEYCQVRSSF